MKFLLELKFKTRQMIGGIKLPFLLPFGFVLNSFFLFVVAVISFSQLVMPVWAREEVKSFQSPLAKEQVYHFDQIGSKIATQEGEVKGVSTAIASIKPRLVKVTLPFWEKLGMIGLLVIGGVGILIYLYFYFRHKHEKDRWRKLELGEHPRHKHFNQISYYLWLLKHLPLALQPGSVRNHPHQLYTVKDNLLILIFHPVFKPLRYLILSWLIFALTFGSSGIYLLKFGVQIAYASYLPGWAKRIKLTVDSSKIDADLTHFPITVFLKAGNGDTTKVFDEVGANKYKIAIADDSNPPVEYYVEIEQWDAVNKVGILHFGKAGEVLPSAVNKDFYLYYDNTHADNTNFVGEPGSAPAQNVWETTNVMTQHMDDNPDTSHIKDSTSYANDGLKKGSNKPIEVDGKIGKAQDYDGTNDSVEVPHNSSIDPTSAWTLEAWVKRRQINVQHSILEKYDWASGKGNYGLRVASNNKISSFVISGTSVNVCGGVTNLAADIWYHVVATFNANTDTLRCYVNGALDNENTIATINPPSSSVSLKIGCRANDCDTKFNGIIDEARIYSKALSPAEIKASYHSTNDSLLTYGSEELTNEPPHQPTNVSPADGATGQDLNLTLTGSTYSDPEDDPQTDTEWQVDDDSDFSSPVWTRTAGAAETTTIVNAANGTFANELAGKTELDHNTTYYWQVRYSDGQWSSWSEATNFTTNLIHTPTNISPADGATVTTLTPLLEASAFSDDQPGHTHAASQWLVDDNSDFSSPAYDSGETDSPETSRAVPGGMLANYTTYYWKVRYKDSSGQWSAYSTSTSFSIQISETAVEVKPVFGNTTVDQGDSVNIDVQVLNFSDGSPLNSATVTINIYNPSGSKIVDGAAMTYISGSNGIYRYSYTVPTTSGSYLYEVTATQGTKSGYGAANFEVRTIASDISSTKLTVESEKEAQTAERTAQAASRAKIEDIQTRVTAVQSDVSTIKSNVSIIKSDVSSAKSTIDSVWSRLQTLTGTLPSDYTGVYEQLVSIANTLARLGVLKGSGAEGLYSLSAEYKDDIKYLKNKILDLQAAIEINKILLAGGAQSSVFSTWYTFRSVVLNMLIANPTNRKATIPFKAYLPKEVKPEHVISSGGLKIEYDEAAQSLVAVGEFELEGGESITREVEIKDIWLIDEGELGDLKRQAEELAEEAKKTAYSGQVTVLKNDTLMRLERILRKQKEATATPQDHILAYRENLEDLTAVKENLKKMTDLVTSAGAGQGLLGSIAGINTLVAWGVIIAIVTGVILLGLTFYSMWKHQMMIAVQLAGKKTGEKIMETEAVDTGVLTLSFLPKINWSIFLPGLKKIFLVIVAGGIVFGVFKGVVYFKLWEKLRKQEQPAVMAPVESKKKVSPSPLPSPTAMPKKVIILETETGWLNVREGPGISFDKVARVDVGDEFIELDRETNKAGEEWVKIQVDEETVGWVLGKYTKEK